jgi:HD-GYP domain-containing protein (c-di-GMP phosphodiesterase class II)
MIYNSNPDNNQLRMEGETNAGEHRLVLELSGLTKTSRMVLNNHPLVILYFPFRLGRLSRSDPRSTANQDLLLPDFRPFFVSRNHIVFDRDQDGVAIIDEASTCGTMVDNTLIGKMTDGRNHALLQAGIHTISIGGPGSPFLFQALVRAQKPSDFLALDHSIPDHLPQARMLYQKLCQYEKRVIEDTSFSGEARVKAAEEMARVMVSRPDLLGPLRCLASNPLCDADYLAQHSVNVAIFMIALYTDLKYTHEDLVPIVTGTLLHDIGMTGIDPAIIRKNGELSKNEFNEIKRHTILGSDLLAETGGMNDIAVSFAGGHHERIDRSGYPNATSMLSDHVRNLGFLDAFEALTHDRPRRQAYTPPEAVRMLTMRENSAFDMETRKTFLNAFSFFPVSSIVKLSTGELGQVVAINRGRPLAPQVRILQSMNGKENESGRLVDLGQEHLISIVKEIPERELFQRYVMS